MHNSPVHPYQKKQSYRNIIVTAILVAQLLFQPFSYVFLSGENSSGFSPLLVQADSSPSFGYFATYNEHLPNAAVYFYSDLSALKEGLTDIQIDSELLALMEKSAMDPDAAGIEVADYGSRLLRDILLNSSDGADSDFITLMNDLYLPQIESAAFNYSNIVEFFYLGDMKVYPKDYEAQLLPGSISSDMAALNNLCTCIGYFSLARSAVNALAAEDSADGAVDLLNFTQGILSLGVRKIFGTTAMSLSLIGLTLLTTPVFELIAAANDLKFRANDALYLHYNRNVNPRSAEEWKEKVIELVEKSAEDMSKSFSDLLMEEVDHFCERWWKLDKGLQAGYETEFKRMSPWVKAFSVQDYEAASFAKKREKITEDYKKQVLKDLYPVMNSVRNYYAQKAADELARKMNDFLEPINRTLFLYIIAPEVEVIDPETGLVTISYPFDGYQVRLREISPKAQEKAGDAWSLTLSGEKNSLATRLSCLGYVMVGSPRECAFWHPDNDPDSDEPDFVLPIEWNAEGYLAEVVIDLEQADLSGNYKLNEVKEIFNDAHKYNTYEHPYTSLQFISDIFGKDINNIGEAEHKEITITATDEPDRYEFAYCFSVGSERREGKGEAEVLPADDGSALLKAGIEQTYESRTYTLIFTIELPPEAAGSGEVNITANADTDSASKGEIPKKKKDAVQEQQIDLTGASCKLEVHRSDLGAYLAGYEYKLGK